MSSSSKGKARVRDASPLAQPVPSERSALLPNRPISRESVDQRSAPAQPRPRRPVLFAAVVTVLSILFALALLVILLVHSYVPPDAEREALVSDAVVWRGPKSVQLVNVTEDGIWLEVEGWVGIDADFILGVKGTENRQGAAWWETLRRKVAHKALAYSPNMSVQLDSDIVVFPKHFATPPLISVHVPDAIQIPLSTNIQEGPHTTEIGGKHVPQWLTPVKTLARVRLIASTGELLDFAKHAWAKGDVEVMVGVRQVQVQPSSGWLQRYLKIVKEDLNLDIYMQG